MWREGGTHSTSAQCSGEHKTLSWLQVNYSYNTLALLEPVIQSKPITWSVVNFKNTADLDEL